MGKLRSLFTQVVSALSSSEEISDEWYPPSAKCASNSPKRSTTFGSGQAESKGLSRGLSNSLVASLEKTLDEECGHDGPSPFARGPPKFLKNDSSKRGEGWVLVECPSTERSSFTVPRPQADKPYVIVAPEVIELQDVKGNEESPTEVARRMSSRLEEAGIIVGQGVIEEVMQKCAKQNRGEVDSDDGKSVKFPAVVDTDSFGENSGSCGQVSDLDSCSIPLSIDYKEDLVFPHPKVVVGEGGFGKVYQAMYNGIPVAVKKIHTSYASRDMVEMLRNELELLSQIGPHGNIVQCYGGCLKRPGVFLVEELMHTDLRKVIHSWVDQDENPKPMPIKKTLQIALDIAEGLNHLHPRIIHRDLKPHNVLLTTDGVAKIADFGLSRVKAETYLSSNSAGMCGTAEYMAPESMRGRLDPKSDIYSLGMIIWECVTGMRPYKNLPNVFAVLYGVALEGLRPSFPDSVICPPLLRELIEDCWKQEASERPSAEQVIARVKHIRDVLF